MKTPRGLSADEAAAWARVAATVRPLDPLPPGEGDQPLRLADTPAARGKRPAGQAGGRPSSADPPPPVATTKAPPAPQAPPRSSAARRASPPHPGKEGLDSHWERRLRAGAVEPDFTLDLHGHTLGSAHARLDSGLAQARAHGARVVLVIAGRPRPADPADRGSARGAIRAKLLDWLAAGPHGADIVAIRQAHRRHGGDGALYLVLKRPR